MAQAYTHGAVHVWTGDGGSGALYLGTGEKAPRVSTKRSYRDVPNDLAGDVPYDQAYMGKQAWVTVRLTRWNEAVLLGAEDTVAVPPLVDTGGFDSPGDMGALMLTEGLARPLWVMYSYGPGSLFPQAAFASMRSGWHFYAAWLVDDEDEGGTDPAVLTRTWHCLRPYVPSTGNFVLFDRNMAGALAAGVN